MKLISTPLLAITLCSIFISCSKKKIDFSNIDAELKGLKEVNFLKKIAGIESYFKKLTSQSELSSCEQDNKYIRQELLNLPLETLMKEQDYLDDVNMKSIYNKVTALQQRIEGLKNEKDNRKCRFAFYGTYTELRYTLDSLLEGYLVNKGYIARDRSLKYSFPHFVSNTDFKFPADLKDGDIILLKTRSVPFTFATELADNPSKFDHLGIIKKDKGNTLLCSSNYFRGISQLELNYFMDSIFRNYGVRFAVYRADEKYDMKKIAHNTCKNIADGNFLQYAHLFDLNPKRYSSTRIIADSTNGRIQNFPQYKTIVNSKNRELLKGYLEEDQTELFFPGDIETDHRFKQLAEYRNLPVLRNFSMQVIGTKNILKQSDTLKFGFEFTKRFIKIRKEKIEEIKSRNFDISKEEDQNNLVSSTVLRKMLINAKREINVRFPDNITKFINRRDIQDYYTTLMNEKFIW